MKSLNMGQSSCINRKKIKVCVQNEMLDKVRIFIKKKVKSFCAKHNGKHS